MKGTNSTASIVISVILLLIAPLIPHHHHEGMACAVTEFCGQDNTYNDKHTYHNQEEESSSYGTYCIEDANFLSSKEDKSFKYCNIDQNVQLLLIDLVSCFNEVVLFNLRSSARISYGKYITSHKSVQLSSSSGLRGPPYSIV